MSSHADTIRSALGVLRGDGPVERDPLVALDALLAENQRLRDALERIASNATMTGTPGVLDRSYSGIQAQAMKQWAREALAGDGE